METGGTVPYAALTPDAVLNALDSVGLHGDGRLLALNSYENRVYQIGMDDGPPLVAKFYRPGRWTNAAILEEHAFVRELVEREIPVVAALPLAGGNTLHESGGFRFAVFPKRGGRAPELDNPATLEWMGRFIGRIHGVGALKPFHERPVLDIRSFGEEPRDYLLSHGFIPADLSAAWSSVAEQALDGVRRCFDRAGDVRTLRLHGDCHAGNVLWTDSGEMSTPAGPPQACPGLRSGGGADNNMERAQPANNRHPLPGEGGRGEGSPVSGPHFVDFDDSRTGPAMQDLWMLLSGERAEMTRQLADLLAGYERFHDFDPGELHLVEALRTLRLIHYSAWIARRWNDPAFPSAFPWFNTQRYWQDRVLELREQVALMDEPPLQPA